MNAVLPLCWLPRPQLYGFIAPEYSENRWPTLATIIPQSFSTKKRKKNACQKAKSVNINNSMVSSEEEEVGEKIKFSLPSSSPARQLHGSDIKFRKFKIDKI